jgi:hypothetical protein
VAKRPSTHAPKGTSQSAAFEHSTRAASKRALIALDASKVSIEANFVIQASGIEARASIEASIDPVVTPRSMHDKNRRKQRDDHRRDQALKDRSNQHRSKCRSDQAPKRRRVEARQEHSSNRSTRHRSKQSASAKQVKQASKRALERPITQVSNRRSINSSERYSVARPASQASLETTP